MCCRVCVCVRVCERESSRGWERAAESQKPPRLFGFFPKFICNNSESGLLYCLVSCVTLVKHFALAGFTTLSMKHRCRFTRKKYTVIITNDIVITYGGRMHALL